jgi:ATP-binding cassette, subfamily B (MDR/TAP), member 1
MMQPSISSQEIELSLASKIASGALSAIETVKCFNSQTFELWTIQASCPGSGKTLHETSSIQLNPNWISTFRNHCYVRPGILVWWHLVTTGRTFACDVLTTFWACLMATKAIEDILPHILVLEKGRAAGAGTKAILDQMSGGLKVNSNAGESAPKFCEGDIGVRDVSRSHPP